LLEFFEPLNTSTTIRRIVVNTTLLTIAHAVRFALDLFKHACAAVMPFGVFYQRGQLARTATGFVVIGTQEPRVGQRIRALAIGERLMRGLTQRREVRR
jgi:hypothetical protein